MLGSSDSGEHLLHSAAAGDAGELLGVHCVQTDVHPLQAGIGEGSGQVLQQQAVGRHCHILDPRDRRNLAHQVHHTGAHGRLPSGQADAAHTQFGRHPHQQQQLLVGEQLLRRTEVDPLRRHAVHTPQVTAVGEGDAEIAQFAAVLVLHGPSCDDTIIAPGCEGHRPGHGHEISSS